jgi:hypothetical protein
MRALLALPLLFLAALSGCSAGSSSNGSSGGALDGDAQAGGEDGGIGGDGGSSSGGNGPSEVRTGTLTILSNAYTIGTTAVEQGTAYGNFYRYTAPTGGASGGCTVQTVGACAVTSCTFATATPGDAGTSASYTNSGPVTVKGVRVNSGTMTLTPGGYGYNTVSGAVAFFLGGESIRLTAPGNPTGAPAFDVALVAPSSVAVSAPTFDTQASVSASATQDLPVAWGATPAAEVAVAMAASGQGKSVQARCGFSAGAGRGVVPAQVLGSLKAMGAATTSIIVSGESRKVQSIDGWDLTVSLQAYGTRSGGLAAGTLKFR